MDNGLFLLPCLPFLLGGTPTTDTLILAEVEREIAEAIALADRLTPVPAYPYVTNPSETVYPYSNWGWEFYARRWVAVFDAALQEIQRARAASQP